MNATIKIKMDNAAFHSEDPYLPAAELARILRVTADKLERYGLANEITCLDSNGNTVGELKITGKR